MDRFQSEPYTNSTATCRVWGEVRETEHDEPEVAYRPEAPRMACWSAPYNACRWARYEANGPFSGYYLNMGRRSKMTVSYDAGHLSWVWSHIEAAVAKKPVRMQGELFSEVA